MSKYDEEILVIPRALFDQLGAFQGVRPLSDAWLTALFAPGNHFFIRRGLAEEDPSYKQIVPYALLVQDGKILHYTRGGGGGEKRLVNLGSIGIGGHLNREDQDRLSLQAYQNLVLRELQEELLIEGEFTNQAVALLNDDSTPVGQVHLGLVHRIDLASGGIARAAEEDIVDPTFLEPSDILARLEQLETWSQLCAQNLDTLLSRP
ncbi:MAG: hypothetical protein ACFCU3_10735 [Verrucomicrobiales bacterium]